MKKPIALSLCLLVASTALAQVTTAPEYDFDKACVKVYRENINLIQPRTANIYDVETGEYMKRKAFIAKYGKPALKRVRRLARTDIANMMLYGAGKLPFDSEGNVVFTEIVSCPDVSAKDLYLAAKTYIEETIQSNTYISVGGFAGAFSWGGAFLSSAVSVNSTQINIERDPVLVDDSDKCLIVAKGVINVADDYLVTYASVKEYLDAQYSYVPTRDVCFKMKIQCRDSQYKIDIYDISCNGMNAEACSDWASLRSDGTTYECCEGLSRRCIINATTYLKADIKNRIARIVENMNNW